MTYEWRISANTPIHPDNAPRWFLGVSLGNAWFREPANLATCMKFMVTTQAPNSGRPILLIGDGSLQAVNYRNFNRKSKTRAHSLSMEAGDEMIAFAREGLALANLTEKDVRIVRYDEATSYCKDRFDYNLKYLKEKFARGKAPNASEDDRQFYLEACDIGRWMSDRRGRTFREDACEYLLSETALFGGGIETDDGVATHFLYPGSDLMPHQRFIAKYSDDLRIREKVVSIAGEVIYSTIGNLS